MSMTKTIPTHTGIELKKELLAHGARYDAPDFNTILQYWNIRPELTFTQLMEVVFDYGVDIIRYALTKPEGDDNFNE